MATSGYARTSTAFGWVQLRWAESSQDIANNKTTINWYLEIYSSSAINSSAAKDYSVTINGSKVSSGTNTIGGSGTRTLKSGSTTITHNSDGSKDFSYSFSQECAIYWGSTYVGTVTGSETDTLDTIPRTSKPTLSDSTVYCGDAVTIYTNRAASFTHTLRYAFGAASGTIATGVATSYAWTVPLSLLNQMTTSTSKAGTIYCDTYSGTTLIGTESVGITLYAKSDVVPTFTAVTHSETVTAASDLAVGYIQSISKLALAITGAAGTYGSTITAYEITFDGSKWTTSSATMTAGIKGSGSLTLTGKITDSRGRTATKSVTVTVNAYSPPVISSFSVARCNSDGTLNDMGTSAKVTRAGTFTSLSAKNTLTVKISSKARGTTTYTLNNTSAAMTGGTVASASVVLSTFVATSSFDFKIEFVDKFNTALSLLVLPTGEVTMSWGPSGVGIGKVWEKGTLDVSGDIYASGKVDAASLVLSGNATVNRLIITNETDAAAGSTTHGLQIGPTTGTNLIIDGNEILARNNGAAAPLYIGNEGNPTTFRGDVTIDAPRLYLTTSGAAGANIEVPAGTNNMYLHYDASNYLRILNNGMDYYGAGVQRWSFGGTGSITVPNNNAALISSTGYVVLRAATANDIYIQADSEVRCVAPGTTATYKPCLASAFTVNSKKSVKTNIEKAKEGALEKVCATRIYDYHLIDELGVYDLDDNENRILVEEKAPEEVKKRKGLILEEAPEELVSGKDNDGIDLYSMTAMSWQAIQELAAQVELLSGKLKNR